VKECYLCGHTLEDHIDSNSKNHQEHIIPQALGGQLKVAGILCKECGGDKYLGGRIDRPFCDTFKLITERLDIKRDRETNPVALNGKLRLLRDGKVIEVRLLNSVLSNRRPEYKIDDEQKVVRIFANETVAKNYKKKVESELRTKIENWPEYKIEIISDLLRSDEYFGVLELPFRVENRTFEDGFAKIAIEFALYNNIPFSTIEHLIDREHRTIKSEATLLPYYPVFHVEEMIEYLRSSIDESFMSHSIVLFSQRQIQENGEEVKQLYCFIELFGTFQYFVCLNNEYVGPDIEPITYCQRIIHSPHESVDMHSLSPKDVHIFMNELGVTLNDIKNKDDGEARRMIEKLYNNRNRYVFDYAENIKRIVDRILQDAILNSVENIREIIPDIVDHFYWNPDTDDFHVTFFRSRYRADNKAYSIIPEIMDVVSSNPEKFRQYTFFKFDELENFINENKKLDSKK